MSATVVLNPTPASRPGQTVVGFADRATSTNRTELGVGALMAWAGALYIQTYLSNSTNDSNGDHGSGLWIMTDPNKPPRLIVEDNGCTVGRMIHQETQRLIIGTSIIDTAGNITPITDFRPGGAHATERIAQFSRDIDDTKVATNFLLLTMNGQLFRMDVQTGAVVAQVHDFGMTSPAMTDSPKHFKSMYRHQDRLYVCANNNGSPGGATPPANGGGGRLYRVDATAYTTPADLDPNHNSWVNIAGSTWGAGHAYATGHDDCSPMLWVYAATASPQAVRKFRVPFGSSQFKHYWQQEWMRCRQVESERYLLDLHGTFFMLSPVMSGGDRADSFAGTGTGMGMPRLEPLANHERIVPDFTTWGGYLVLGGNHNSSVNGSFIDSGQSTSSLLFTTIDDLKKNGKPTGYGYWYKVGSVTATESLPMLARGYDRKSLSFINGTGTSVDVDVNAYIDNQPMKVTTVTVPANGGASFQFAQGFACDWISVTPKAACTSLTARIDYT